MELLTKERVRNVSCLPYIHFPVQHLMIIRSRLGETVSSLKLKMGAHLLLSPPP